QQLVLTRHRTPDLARATEQLADRGVGLRVWIRGELLGVRIESDDGVRAEVGEPHDVLVIDVHRVRHRVAGELPLASSPSRSALRLEHADLAGIPLTDPDTVVGSTPHPTRALISGGQVERCRAHRLDIDVRNVAARERCVEHRAVRAGRDAVWPRSTWSLQNRDGAVLQVAVEAVLPGEPYRAVPVERRGVEIDVRSAE